MYTALAFGRGLPSLSNASVTTTSFAPFAKNLALSAASLGGKGSEELTDYQTLSEFLR